MLYHGSADPSLIAELSSDGVGTVSNCSAFFCTSLASRARDYGPYVYRTPSLRGDEYLDNCDVDADVLWALLEENGIDVENNQDLCWHAVATEELSAYDEDDAWAALVGKDWDDAVWFAQSLRIELARRQGFKGAAMNDECGSLAVLREYAQFERVKICEECGQDSEFCDCDDAAE